MAYTNLSTSFVYKTLLTHQLMDQLAENDDLFQKHFLGTTDITASMKFDNTFGIRGEVAAGGSYKNMITFDSGDVVQLGVSGTEVRVPAAPTNALGVANKAYVDSVIQKALQAEVSVSITGGLATILNVASSNIGTVHAIWFQKLTNVGVVRVKITVDGTVVVDESSPSISIGNWGAMVGNLNLLEAGSTEAEAGRLIEIPFSDSLLIEAVGISAEGGTIKVSYSLV